MQFKEKCPLVPFNIVITPEKINQTGSVKSAMSSGYVYFKNKFLYWLLKFLLSNMDHFSYLVVNATY